MSASQDTFFTESQRELKERQAALERALQVASAQDSEDAAGADAVTWGLNESYAGNNRPGTAGSAASKNGGKPSRSQMLQRYFDAMSDYPDYDERRRQRMQTAKPFSFMERELTRAKSTSTRRVEADTIERIEREESELRAKFRANPVPPTTFVPKYEMMVEEWCARKEALRIVAERRAEELRAAEAPGREFAAAMMAAKPKTGPRNAEEAHEAWKAKHCKPFAARPVPKAVVMPRMKELEVRESDRKARIASRANELLAVSKAPPRMRSASAAGPKAKGPTGSKGSKADIYALQKANPEFSFKPKVRPEVPNYEEHHARERLRLELRRQHRPPTGTTEFRGLAERSRQSEAAAEAKAKRRAASAQMRVPRGVSPKVASVLVDMSIDEVRGKETRWPYRGTRARVPPANHDRARSAAAKATPPVATRSHSLAAESTFRHIVSRHESAAAEAEAERLRAEKQRLANSRMSAVLVELGVDQTPVAQRIEEETRKKREANAAQAREYARQRQHHKEELDAQIPRFLQPGSAADRMHSDASARAQSDGNKAVELLKKHGLGEKTLRDVLLASHKAQLDGVEVDVVAVQDAAPATSAPGAPGPDTVHTADSGVPGATGANPSSATVETVAAPEQPVTVKPRAPSPTSSSSSSSSSDTFESDDGSSSSSASSPAASSRSTSRASKKSQ